MREPEDVRITNLKKAVREVEAVFHGLQQPMPELRHSIDISIARERVLDDLGYCAKKMKQAISIAVRNLD